MAVIRVEQLYPFPHKAFAAELKKYPNATDIVWCQDEPQNQGAWFFVQHYVHENMLDGQKLGYAGRAGQRQPGLRLCPPAPGAAEGAAGPGLRQAQGLHPHQVKTAPRSAIPHKDPALRFVRACTTSHRIKNTEPHTMAIVDVQVPQFSESVSEGTLLTWKKKPGEAVTIDETLVEIETDKVVPGSACTGLRRAG